MVEAYVSRATPGIDAGHAKEVFLAAEQLAREGLSVRFLGSIFVPEDETCFYLYRAQSAEDVRIAATRAGLVFDRVREVVSDRTPPGG